eukprot:scaffold7983_cov45-Attheya_sp.AAC.3
MLSWRRVTIARVGIVSRRVTIVVVVFVRGGRVTRFRTSSPRMHINIMVPLQIRVIFIIVIVVVVIVIFVGIPIDRDGTRTSSTAPMGRGQCRESRPNGRRRGGRSIHITGPDRNRNRRRRRLAMIGITWSMRQ